MGSNRILDIGALYKPLEQQRAFHESPAKFRLYGGAAGGGKDLCIDMDVLTDSGWKRAGDVNYNDMLVAPNGSYTKILGIYPKKNRGMYEITFQDGRWIKADKYHLWLVKSNKHGNRDGWIVRTTEDIVKSKDNWVIPLCDAMPGEKWKGVDPYICGLLLGDGTLTADTEILYTIEEELIKYLESKGWHSHKYEYQNTTMVQSIGKERNIYKAILGRISGERKRVPKCLLMADAGTRLAVLQGLMDTDGHHDKPPKGGAGFTNKSEQLCKDVIYLVRSLGGKATIHKVIRPNRKVRSYSCGDVYYKVNVSHLGKFNPFRLSRKKLLVNLSQGNNSLGIKSIKKIKRTDGVCFLVEHPSHLFVVKDFIVTHNTYAVIWEAIMRCLKYDFPVVGAIFRRSYPELESTIIRTMQNILPTWFYKYNQAQHIMTFKTGDQIEFCYAETYSDVLRYQGREWDWLAIDELTHFTQDKFTYLWSRVRTTKKMNVKFFGATNPGGLGHIWVKSRWIDKDSKDPGYDASEYEFIPSKVTDNLYLMKANPDYVKNLKMLPENERKALLDGSWDIFEGQFFNDFNPIKHVVGDFEVPENWRLVLGWDEGQRLPRAVELLAIDNDDRVWVVWEYYRTGEITVEAARNIKSELEAKGYWNRIIKTVVDPSMRIKPTGSGITTKSILEGLGFGFQVGEVELGNNKREDGWRVLRSYLKFEPYEEPMIKIFASCSNLIRTLPQLVYIKETALGGTKEDIDTRQEDHAVDALRYALMSLEDMPNRFRRGYNFEVVGRNYAPRSTYGAK